MQKKVLTIAVAGALIAASLARAQGSGPPTAAVEVYGTINLALGRVKYSEAANGAPGVTKWDVLQSASNYGVRGRDSLGGGLTAWFQIESNAPMERSNSISATPASRNSAVGIQGPLGNLFLGQWTTPWADLDGIWSIGTVGNWGPVASIIGRRGDSGGTAPNPNCDNYQSSGGISLTAIAGIHPPCDAVKGGGGVGHPFWRRPSQSVVYQSPVLIGVQFKLLYQTDEGKATVATSADPSMISTSLQWAGMGGRARMGVALDRHKDFTTVGKSDTGYALKGGYNFGVVDLGLAYENFTYKTPLSDCKTSNYAVALAIPMGQGAIRGAYSRAKPITGAYAGVQATVNQTNGSCGATVTAANQADQNGARQYNIGYDHRFSKRTTVGAGYTAIKNDPAANFSWTSFTPIQDGASLTPLAGSDVSTAFVVITHRF